MIKTAVTPLAGTDVSGAYAAGARYSTVEDMYLWDQRGLNCEKLIETGTLDRAFSPATLNNGNRAKYGFGWMVEKWRGLKKVSQGGDITGFNSYFARFPDEQFTVIVLSNIEHRPPGPIESAGDLANKITEIYLADKLDTTKMHTAIALDRQILERYTGQYKLVNAPVEVVQFSGETYTIFRKDNKLFIQSILGERNLCRNGKQVLHRRQYNDQVRKG